MTDSQNGDSISLEVVKQRFLDSESALSDLLEGIQQLQTSEQTAAGAAGALKEAAKRMGDYTAAAERMTDEMRRAQEQVARAAETSEKVLGGEALTEIRGQLTQLEEALTKVTELQEQLGQPLQSLLERVSGLETKVSLVLQHKHGFRGGIKR